jgi:hypothetical protein
MKTINKILTTILAGTIMYSCTKVDTMPKNSFKYIGREFNTQMYSRTNGDKEDLYLISDNNLDGLLKDKSDKDGLIDSFFAIVPISKGNIFGKEFKSGEWLEQDSIFTNMYLENENRELPLPLEKVSKVTIDYMKQMIDASKSELDILAQKARQSYANDVFRNILSSDSTTYNHNLSKGEAIGIAHNLNIFYKQLRTQLKNEKGE